MEQLISYSVAQQMYGLTHADLAQLTPAKKYASGKKRYLIADVEKFVQSPTFQDRIAAEKAKVDRKWETLQAGVGKNLYQRCKLLAKSLDDSVGIVSLHFGGDESAFRKYFERTYFNELMGLTVLNELADLYRAFPNEQDWIRNDYSFAKLRLLLMKKEEPLRLPPAPRTNWKQKALDLEVELEVLTADNERLRKRISELEGK